MEQHSKAVEDLKAAAAIAPGDKEVGAHFTEPTGNPDA